jgi:Flp pilus assembly pilin Flp
MTKLNQTIGLRFALLLQGVSLQNVTRVSLQKAKRDEGQTLGEYAMILALIAVVVAVIVATLGGTISSIFSKMNSEI